jgi:hypothetical protein
MVKECCKQCAAICAYVVAVGGAFLIVAALVWVMIHYTRPTPLGDDRANVRRETLKELRANNEEILNNPNYVWQDQNKGVVRLPISRAMELTLKLWENPAAARSNLVARVEKATAVAPPPSYE